MDDATQVQDENLVNDQVTQAIADSGVTEEAPAAEPAVADDAAAVDPAAAVPTVPTEPVEAPEVADTGTAEASPLNTDPVSAPMIETPEAEAPAVEEEAPAETPQIATSTGPVGGGGDDDSLMSVKQAALEQLSPLVDHLDLPPDQKFDTYMEIPRASDDKSLVQPAFDEAQKIDDEDKKAQALLDVVNEVNYLTQDHEASE